jgi:hypothetical protein
VSGLIGNPEKCIDGTCLETQSTAGAVLQNNDGSPSEFMIRSILHHDGVEKAERRTAIACNTLFFHYLGNRRKIRYKGGRKWGQTGIF